MRHAPNLYRLRYRGIITDTGRDLRRCGFSSVAGRRADGWTTARLDADLGFGSNGAQCCGSATSVLGPNRNGRPRTAAFPLDRIAIATARSVDLGRLRMAFTEDFGQCPVGAEVRRVFRSRIAAMRHLFSTCDEVTFDFGEADRCFDVVRAQSYVDRYRDAYTKDPNSLGPNVRANYEMAAHMTLADMAWAHAVQTRIFRRFQASFRSYDLVLSPTVPVSPFPWTQLYLEELEGARLRNYYHWLALTYVVTLVTNPAISIPCGIDEHAMPFGLQVTGRFRGDRELLDAAEAMEQAFANMPGLGRPRPDLGKLARSTVDLKSIATHPPLQAATAEC